MYKLIQLARAQAEWLLIAVLLSVAGGVLTVLQAFWLSRTVSRVFLAGQGLRETIPLLLALAAAALLRAGFVYTAETSASAASRRIRLDLRQRLYEHIQALGPAYRTGESGETDVHSGELVNTAMEGIEALDAYFSQYLPQLVLAALIPLSILIFVFPADLLSGIILLLTAPLLPILMMLIGSAAREQTSRQWLGLSRMAAYFLDVLQGLPALKTLGRSLDQLQTIARVSERYRQATLSVLRITFLSAFALEFIATVSTAIVAVQIGLRLLAGDLTFEPAFFILLLAPEFYLPIRLLGQRFHAGMSGLEAGRRIFELLDIPLPHQVASAGTPAFNSTAPRIVFDSVNYAYRGERHALRGASFTIEPGKVTAITGPSGAGKSTAASLLLRFLEAQSGQILVDGIDLCSVPLADWRASLSWTTQAPYLFNDTIAANLRLGNPQATAEQLAAAARLARADEFIERLPEGYETIIGERGARLSAGQVQRLALARAFLRGSGLVILDEAASHLDPDNEAHIGETARQLAAAHTVLLIAHRPETLAYADTVITLKEGKVIETYSQSPRGEGSGDEGTNTLPVGERSDLRSLPSLQGEDEGRPLPSSQKPILLRTLRLLKPFSPRVLLSVLLGFATVSSSAGLMAAAAYIISYAALQPSIAELQVAIVGVRFFGLSRAVFRYLERLVAHDITLRLLANWRAWFYQALEPLAPARLWRYQSGDLLSRAIADVGVLENLYVRAVAPPLTALLVAIGGTAFLSHFVPASGMILLGFLLLGGVALPLSLHALARRSGLGLVQARAHLSTLLVDGIQGLPDLLVCGQAGLYQDRIDQAGQRLAHHQTHINRLSAAQSALNGLVAQVCMLAVLATAIPAVASGRMDGIWLGALMLAALACFEAVQPLSQAAQTLEASLQAARRLFQVVDATPEVNDPANPAPVPSPTLLEVKGLSFSYPDGTTALQDISFSLRRGQHLVLVGPSGAGKTTLVNLLLRYWEYSTGHIRLDGQELRDFCGEELRSKIAVVSQDAYIFNASIGDNLRIARPSASQGEIEKAARLAQIHEFILSLPEGYNTWAGETGQRLSGGQRQRIAIARALLKDAPILILDEPTANLDLETEQAILQAVHTYARERMMLTITHRPAALETADQVLVLSGGRVVERTIIGLW
jgi:ATP-binding cassette subfamily C protein CydCD